MATLQKFKFLATQCAVIGSPTRSPTTSPVIHIRRRKTLKMLLSGKTGNNTSVFNRRFIQHSGSNNNSNRRRIESSDRQQQISDQKSTNEKENNSNHNNNRSNHSNSNSIGVRLKLKDLFVSSPPPPKVPEEQRLLPVTGGTGGGDGGLAVVRRGGVRPLSATLRQRLLMRRIWRPVLVAIPELD